MNRYFAWVDRLLSAADRVRYRRQATMKRRESEPGSVNWDRKYPEPPAYPPNINPWASKGSPDLVYEAPKDRPPPSPKPPSRGHRDRDDWLQIAQVCVKHGRTRQDAAEIADGLLADLKSRFDKD